MTELKTGNERGDTLIGVMIAVAVGSLVLITFLAIIENMMSVQANLKAKAEAEDVMSGVRLAFSGNSANCRLNFPNVSISGPGTIAIDPNVPFRYSNTDGNTLTAEELIAVGRNYAGVTVTYMNFVVRQALAASLYSGVFQAGFEPTGGGSLFVREIPINFALDAAGRVNNCGPTETDGTPLSGSCPAGTVLGFGGTVPAAPITYEYVDNAWNKSCTCRAIDLDGNVGWDCSNITNNFGGNADASDAGF